MQTAAKSDKGKQEKFSTPIISRSSAASVNILTRFSAFETWTIKKNIPPYRSQHKKTLEKQTSSHQGGEMLLHNGTSTVLLFN